LLPLKTAFNNCGGETVTQAAICPLPSTLKFNSEKREKKKERKFYIE
jgi:hypothetical protein